MELHEKGWVNSEWQEYVDSDKNIQVKDGKLLIKPVETVNADGTRSYTSGRINTQANMILSMDILSAVQKFRPEKAICRHSG